MTGRKLFLDVEEAKLENSRDNFHAPILIMGSSGSGRTPYSKMLLPKHLQKLFRDKKYFLVYVFATKNALPDPIKVKNQVEETMLLKVEMDSTATENPAKLTNATELTMVVVIDEVGLSSHEKQVNTRDALNQYKASQKSVLTENKWPKICSSFSLVQGWTSLLSKSTL